MISLSFLFKGGFYLVEMSSKRKRDTECASLRRPLPRNSSVAAMDSLPKDIRLHIMTFLSVEDLVSVRKTCKRMEWGSVVWNELQKREEKELELTEEEKAWEYSRIHEITEEPDPD